MIKDHFYLAFKNIRNRGIRSWLTMLGIFIGIAAVVSLISLGQGLQTAVTGQFGALDVDKLTITNAETGFGPPGSTAIRKLNENDLEIIEDVNGVDLAIGRLIRVVEVEYNGITKFKYVTNIPEEKEEIELVYDSFNMDLESGRKLTKNDRKKIIIGNDFIDAGFGRDIKIGKSITIQSENFEVVGILKPSSSFQLNLIAILPEEDLREILDIDDEIDLIVAQVEDKDDIGRVAENIRDELRDDRDLDIGEEDFSVESPTQALGTVNTILTIINLIVGGIAAISLLVGGIGIANTMYTSVLERTREIGVMKAVGAKNKDILSIFLMESSLLGFVGGLIGALMGISLSFIISFGVNSFYPGIGFDVAFSPLLFSSAIVFSLVIGGMSGILPAIQASKLKPVDALRQ